ncbi:MAG: hypothetical protein JXR64_01910 [Spirochaetales bacterium]|nr:hypothetical protein [Spirochaetales bacterium]
MAVQIKIINIKEKKRKPAVRCEGALSRELGEAVAEMLPDLLEIGTPLNQISTMLWGKQC